MLCSIIFIILLIPSLVYAKGEWDYNNVYPKLNDTKYLKKIKPYLFLYYNKEYTETNNYDEKIFKKILQCWDAIYYAQIKSYNYNKKIQYYYDRARITMKYSENESIKYWEKYLYISFKATDAVNNKNVELTVTAEFVQTAINVLKKHIEINKNNVRYLSGSELEIWKNYVYNNESLKKEVDINNNVFEKSK